MVKLLADHRGTIPQSFTPLPSDALNMFVVQDAEVNSEFKMAEKGSS